MNVSNYEIQRSVKKWLRIALDKGDLPIILMPFDPEGSDDYDPAHSGRRHVDSPLG